MSSIEEHANHLQLNKEVSLSSCLQMSSMSPNILFQIDMQKRCFAVLVLVFFILSINVFFKKYFFNQEVWRYQTVSLRFGSSAYLVFLSMSHHYHILVKIDAITTIQIMQHCFFHKFRIFIDVGTQWNVLLQNRMESSSSSK